RIAAQQAADEIADALAAAQLVLVVLECAVQEKCVERVSVARRHDVSAGDVGTRRRASSREERQQARMVRRYDSELRDGGEGIRARVCGDMQPFVLRSAQELGVLDAPLRVGAQP